MSKYIGNIPVPNATQTRTRIVATSGQTSFTTSDSYTPGYIDVFLGGVKLDSTEFTATDGTTVVLASGANTGQIFESISYTTYNLDTTVAPQTSNSGKYLTTDGTNTSWVDVNTTEASGAFKLTNYTTAERDALTGLTAGDTIYNSTAGSIEFYNGVGWSSTNPAPSIGSITGNIYEGAASTLTLSVTNATSTIDVKYYEGATLLATDSGVTVTSGSATSTVPSAVYGQTAGDTISIKILNSNGVLSSNSVNKTVTGLPTGGTITTSGSYRIHTFTSSSSLVTPSGFSDTADVLIVAGGGAGGWDVGGGGGAGGLLSQSTSLSAGSYTITVGAGATSNGSGTGFPAPSGGNSSAFGLTALGGGGGGDYSGGDGGAGGSGGGGSGYTGGNNPGGVGTSGQGNAGGAGRADLYGTAATGGGGGGASALGTQGISNSSGYVNGGVGVSSSISGSSVTYATGGKGAGDGYTGTADGAANTGDGGDGAGTGLRSSQRGAFGGSGVVIIRYAL